MAHTLQNQGVKKGHCRGWNLECITNYRAECSLFSSSLAHKNSSLLIEIKACFGFSSLSSGTYGPYNNLSRTKTTIVTASSGPGFWKTALPTTTPDRRRRRRSLSRWSHDVWKTAAAAATTGPPPFCCRSLSCAGSRDRHCCRPNRCSSEWIPPERERRLGEWWRVSWSFKEFEGRARTILPKSRRSIQ